MGSIYYVPHGVEGGSRVYIYGVSHCRVISLFFSTAPEESCPLDLAVAEMGCLHWFKIPISVAVMSSHVTLAAVISGEGWPLVI